MDTRKIIADLQAERARIDRAIEAIQSLDGAVSSGRTAAQTRRAVKTASGGGQKRGRRTMSPAARKRISEMMKQRWAERKRKSKAA